MRAFLSFLIHEKANRRLLMAAIACTAAQWVLFKLLYPYADFFSDSYSYIEAAAAHATVNIWPIGYSWFLRLFHSLSYSDTAMVSFQYFFLVLGELLLFFTLLYFYRPSRNSTWLLWAFFFCNPLLLYLSNYVSSDSLFTALSLLWLVQLIWIIQQPVWYQVVTHAVLLLLAFCVRYNALYYPLIGALALFASKLPRYAKWGGLALSILLLAWFINYTSNQTQRITGTRQFSVFSGWQLGNNALYVYPHITVPYRIFPPGKSRDFNRRVVRRYFDSTHPESRGITPLDGAFYIRYQESPLKQYFFAYVREHPATSSFQAWGGVSPVFAAFGNTIIKNYPFAFARHYLLPNSINYFIPPLEKLEVYNIGMKEVLPIAQLWFHYKSTRISAVSASFQGILLFIVPPLFLVLNSAFLLCAIGFARKKKWQQMPQELWLGFLLAGTLLLVNAGFSILASPVVMRYQVFAMLVLFAFTLLLVEQLEKKVNEV